jgi:Zn-dependent peptidase ImmA (M78 family)
MQRLLHWILSKNQESATHLPETPQDMDPLLAGTTLRNWVGVSFASQQRWPSARVALEAWRAAFEERGIHVLQLQLGGWGLRGFSLFDQLAPVIAVNTAENYEARAFTLFHELAHLASGTESVCLERVGGRSSRTLERWCEEVASAALLPPAEISRLANSLAHQATDEFHLVSLVASASKASLRATALALIRQTLVNRDVYEDIEERAPALDKEKRLGGGGGQRAPERRKGELGIRTVSLVLGALEHSLLTERDARNYLRLDGAEVEDLSMQIEAR